VAAWAGLTLVLSRSTKLLYFERGTEMVGACKPSGWLAFQVPSIRVSHASNQSVTKNKSSRNGPFDEPCMLL